jgi:hypothetical protein
MICETCRSEGKTSRVYDRGSSMTLLNCTPFYDEQGRQHYHDSNTTTSGYECSNGHSWVVKSKPSCWCGWPNEQKTAPAEPAAPAPEPYRAINTNQWWSQPPATHPPVVKEPTLYTRQQVEAMLRIALTDRTDEWMLKTVDERVTALLSMFTLPTTKKEKP